MGNDGDRRNDDEEAFRLIKQAHLSGGVKLGAPADPAFAPDLQRQNQEAIEKAQRQEDQRILSGRFYIAEAAYLIAHQLGKSADWIEAMKRDMADASTDGRLVVRSPVTNLPVSPDTAGTLARIVHVSDVNAWLDAQGAGFRWEEPRAQQAAIAPPVQRRRSQELAVLAKLKELGHDPKALKPAPRGRVSKVKQAVFAELLYTPAVFDKAWQRLRNMGEIKDA